MWQWSYCCLRYHFLSGNCYQIVVNSYCLDATAIPDPRAGLWIVDRRRFSSVLPIFVFMSATWRYTAVNLRTTQSCCCILGSIISGMSAIGRWQVHYSHNQHLLRHFDIICVHSVQCSFDRFRIQNIVPARQVVYRHGLCLCSWPGVDIVGREATKAAPGNNEAVRAGVDIKGITGPAAYWISRIQETTMQVGMNHNDLVAWQWSKDRQMRTNHGSAWNRGQKDWTAIMSSQNNCATHVERLWKSAFLKFIVKQTARWCG